MVSVNQVDKIMQCLRKCEMAGLSERQAMFKISRQIASGFGKPSAICYEGKFLEDLPEAFRALTVGLKRPKIVAAVKSGQKGQGVFGLTVKDGNQVRFQFASGVDFTQGEVPIIQMRGAVKNSTSTVASFNTLFNPNVELNPKAFNKVLKQRADGSMHLEFLNVQEKPGFMADIYCSEEAANVFGLKPKDINKMRRNFANFKVSELNKAGQDITTLMKNKGITIRPVEVCMQDFIEIAQKTGAPTEEVMLDSAKKIFMKMGYKPSDINVKMTNTGYGVLGGFNSLTGEMCFSEEFLKHTYQDFAQIFLHETVHMEDFVRLYKKVGAEKFRKMVGGDFNAEWYEKMAKCVDDKSISFAQPRTVKITTSEGKVITKPGEIRKHQLEYNGLTPNFEMRGIQKELRGEQVVNEQLSHYTDYYSHIKAAQKYSNSSIENHARYAESRFLEDLSAKGVLRETEYSLASGKAPLECLQVGSGNITKTRMEFIEKALSKNGGDVNERFNALYHQVLSEIEPEIANKHKMLFDAMKKSPENYETIAREIDDIVNKNYGSYNNLIEKVLNQMYLRVY